MAEFGNFTEKTWTNGSGESINATTLNARETKIGQLDEECRRSQAISFSEYKDYFTTRSTQLISTFENKDDWTLTDGTATDDSTYNRVGKSSVKIADDDAASGWLRIYRADFSLSVNDFLNSDDSSSTSDYFYLLFYCNDSSKVSSITVRVGKDTSNYFYFTFSSGISTGYQSAYLTKSGFNTSGTVAWSDTMTYISVGWNSTSGASGDYVIFDILSMVRASGGAPHPWLLDDGNGNWDIEIFQPQAEIYQYFDPFFGKIGLQKGGGTWEYGLHVYCDVTDFVCEIEHYVTVEDELSNFRWGVDANNYIDVYVTSGTLYIDEYIFASGGHVDSFALGYTLEKFSKARLIIEKNGTYIRVILKTLNYTIALDYETVLGSEGCIYICGSMNTSNFSFVSDFVVSHLPTNLLTEEWTTPKLLKNETVESSSNNSSWVNISDCQLGLSHGLYEIELNLFFNCAAETPDITVSFNTSKVELLNQNGGIGAIGPAVDSTNPGAAEEGKFAGYDALDDEIYFGTDINVAYAVIKMVVRVEDIGATFQPRFHQRNTDGSNPVYVRKETYMKVTKLDGSKAVTW
jgi:hypothetical protein